MTQEEVIEDLREQVAYWKSEALGNRDTDRRAKLQVIYGITQSQAELLDAMYAKRGGLLSKVQAEEAVTGYGDERCGNTVDVQICRLRKKVPEGWVQTVRAQGWCLTDQAIDIINRLTES